MASPDKSRQIADAASGVRDDVAEDVDRASSSVGYLARTFEGQVAQDNLRLQAQILNGHYEAHAGETSEDAKRRAESKGHATTLKATSSNPISSIFSAAVGTVANFVSNPIASISNIWDRATGFASDIGSGISNTFSSAARSVSRFAENAYDVGSNALDYAGNTLQSGFNFISNLPGKLGLFEENKFDMLRPAPQPSAPAPVLRPGGPSLFPL